MAEFNCVCSNKYFHWCAKDGYSKCKRCSNTCQPVKILINSRFNSQKENNSNNFNANASFSDGSFSTSSNCSSGIRADIDFSSDKSANNSYFSNNRPQRSFRYGNGYMKFINGSYFCGQCHDTYVNLNSNIVFRPTRSIYQEFIPIYQDARGND